MTKMRNGMIALAAISLLAVGVVAIAGNGFGNSAEWNVPAGTAGDCGSCEADRAADCAGTERDAEGNGICNSEDPDRARPANGAGYGERQGCGLNRADDRPLDGTGYGRSCARAAGYRCAGGFARGGCS